jgi:hypothetical protein
MWTLPRVRKDIKKIKELGPLRMGNIYRHLSSLVAR